MKNLDGLIFTSIFAPLNKRKWQSSRETLQNLSGNKSANGNPSVIT